jgi:phage/plasmid primase-like uncharacterized protein
MLTKLHERTRAFGLSLIPTLGRTRPEGSSEWCFVRQVGRITLAWYGDWKKGTSEEWISHDLKSLPEGEREKVEHEIRAHLEEQRKEREKRWISVQIEAAEMWMDSTTLGTHSYIENKKLSGLHGARIHINEAGHAVLLVPMRDIDGKLWNVTRIYGKTFESGNKFVLAGGKKRGLFHIIDGMSSDKTYVCEGFATAASVFEALQGESDVVCAFDAGNLVEVVKEFKKHHPHRILIVCGDDDRHKPEVGNAGRVKAMEALGAGAEQMIFPEFAVNDGKSTDFNDLAIQEGLERVREQLLRPSGHGAGEVVTAAPVMDEPPKQGSAAIETRIVKNLLDDFGPTLIRHGKDVFEYDKVRGCFDHSESDAALAKFYPIISRAIGAKGQHRHVMSAYSRFFNLLPLAPRNPFEPDRYKVAFQNGTLHLEPKENGNWTPVLKPHDQSDLLIHSHPFNYTKDVEKNAEFEDLVARVLGNDQELIKSYYQILGASLFPGAFRKLVFFVGPPQSGKSSLIQFPYHLVDERFRCGVDPTQMFGFHTESLAGKILNADPDIRVKGKLTDSILKKIEDGVSIRVQRKGQKDLHAQVPGMHLFGANGMPETEDGADPYARRMIIVPCDSYTAPANHNKRIVSEIMARNLPGIVARAIDGLEELCSQGGHFTVAARSLRAMRGFQETNENEISLFIKDLKAGEALTVLEPNSTVKPEKGGDLRTAQVWVLFKTWFEMYFPRRTMPGRNTLYARLQEAGFSRSATDGREYFRGLTICENASSRQ